MTEVVSSAALAELDRYARENQKAILLLNSSASDYADARCLLINGMLGGLPLGAQAVEKVLKAYLLFYDPQRNVRKLSHKLPDLLTQTSAIFPSLNLMRFESTAIKFAQHYDSRYPDNPNASTSRTTADRFELDDVMIFLNENLPCPRHVRHRAGLNAFITSSLSQKGTMSQWERWIKIDNRALAPLIEGINSESIQVLQELHPDQDMSLIFANTEAS